MKTSRMNILVTLDKNYLGPLRVMLGSMFLNNPGEPFDVYMIGDGLSEKEISDLQAFCGRWNSALHPVEIPEGLFDRAPTMRYYTKAMYYRLLAADLLPQSLDRILYLDPDILVIGQVRPLYNTELLDHLVAAASHSAGLTDYMNKIRLKTPDAEGYFNSGVLLMNLEQMRRDVHAQEIFSYAEEHADTLLLPDQDILNGMYGSRVLPVDDAVWNYDARQFEKHVLRSQGKENMDWVMEHTVFLHFCGKEKPWNKSYRGRFSALYKQYRRLILRWEAVTHTQTGQA